MPLPILLPIFLIAGFLISDPALACAVCGAGEDESTGAFMISTAMLTFTPLMVLGAIGYYLFRRFHPEGKSLFEAFKSALSPSESSGQRPDHHPSPVPVRSPRSPS